jgi:hypothetical protein
VLRRKGKKTNKNKRAKKFIESLANQQQQNFFHIFTLTLVLLWLTEGNILVVDDELNLYMRKKWR